MNTWSEWHSHNIHNYEVVLKSSIINDINMAKVLRDSYTFHHWNCSLAINMYVVRVEGIDLSKTSKWMCIHVWQYAIIKYFKSGIFQITQSFFYTLLLDKWRSNLETLIKIWHTIQMYSLNQNELFRIVYFRLKGEVS